MKTSVKAPLSIALNAIDRSFLIPETADMHGTYFPMTFLVTVTLQRALDTAIVLAALNQLETQFPQLRLGYALDLDALCWRRVPDHQLSNHLAAMVSNSPAPAAPLETVLDQIVNTNIMPFSLPLAITLHQNALILKLNHSFSDGMLSALILKYLLTAIDTPEQVSELPPLTNFEGLSLLQLVRQQPDYVRALLRGWVKTIRDFSPGKSMDILPERRNPDRQSIASGSPMRVKLHRVSPDVIQQIKKMRSGLASSIAMNTILQVLVAHRLHELGYLGEQVNYTIPVDLHRYLADPATYYTGNLSSQIRVTVTEQPLADIAAQCQAVQAEVDAQLEARVPLYSPTLDWLMRVVGRKRYNQMNRDWYKDSINTDPRLFVLSNLGDMTRPFRQFSDLIDFDGGMYAVAPLMGGPPLIIVLGIVKGHGNLGITYDPQVFTDKQIDDILALFDANWLAQRLNLQETIHVLDY